MPRNHAFLCQAGLMACVVGPFACGSTGSPGRSDSGSGGGGTVDASGGSRGVSGSGGGSVSGSGSTSGASSGGSGSSRGSSGADDGGGSGSSGGLDAGGGMGRSGGLDAGGGSADGSALAATGVGPLAVSANHRFLQHADATPFFWLGDTAWVLFQHLNRTEVDTYLENRRLKGFTVIQAVALWTPKDTNVYGQPALTGGDPAKPATTPGSDPAIAGQYDYWDHVDYVFDRAAQKGIYIALVATWGAQVRSGIVNAANAPTYIQFLIDRYKTRNNLIWVMGGDTPGDAAVSHGDIYQTMGSAIRASDPNHLITYHPRGRMDSATWFNADSWLDFNMFQSGHQTYLQDPPPGFGEDNWSHANADFLLTPMKPTFDGEPSYENIPQGLHDVTLPYWTDADCRRYAYWSVFAGSFGHTYGNNAIQQMYRPVDAQIDAGVFGPTEFWTQAIDDPGAGEMTHLKALILSRPFFERVPDQTAIAGTNGVQYERVAVTRGASYLFAYTYTGRPFSLQMGVISGARVTGWWFNPRDGTAQSMGSLPNVAQQTFTPPGTPDNPLPGTAHTTANDWVLVLDDESKGYAPPGQ